MFKKINTIFQVISVNQYRQKMFVLVKVGRRFNPSVLLVLVILHIFWLPTQLWTCYFWTCFMLCIPFQLVLVLFLTFVLKAFSALTPLYLPGSSLKKEKKKKAALRPSNQFLLEVPRSRCKIWSDPVYYWPFSVRQHMLSATSLLPTRFLAW